jgi:hypothetical protein
MKHIKLFEGFSSSNPVITATGDWSKLNWEGTPIDFLHANTYIVTYHTNPTPDVVAKMDSWGDMTVDPEQAVDDIMGGDQSGSYIFRQGEIIFPADPSYSPEDYKNRLLELVDHFNTNPEQYEADMCQSLLEDPELVLTPEFLSHCKAVVAGSEMSQKYISKFPEYYSKHPEILPGGNRSRIKIMSPRIELIFRVV